MNLEEMYLSGKAILEQPLSTQNKTHYVRAPKLKHLKITVAVSILVIIALVLAVANLTRKNHAQANEQTRLMAQINSLHRQLGQEATALDSATTQQQSSDVKAMSYIEGIEQKLTKINSYLSKRGLHGFSFKHIRPAASTAEAKVSGEKIYSSYNDYLTRLVNNVAFMPMGYPRISAFTSFFGYRGNPFDFGASEFHPGIDFRGKTGDPVKCTANGTVEFAGKAGGYGNCVRIKHINNIETLYGHLSHINVHEGERVSVGDIIGKVGSTGRSTGSHLHYEIRRNGKPVNPVQYLTLN